MGSARRAWVLTGGALMVVSLAVLGTLAATGAFGSGQTGEGSARQEQIARRGGEVMPFDLEATTHVFEKNEEGGVQRVVADDPGDAGNVAAIRAHLREEADAFARGEFSDPAAIHGEDMPGLAELEAGAGRIGIRYEDVRAGAQITLRSEDQELVGAVHEWFDAQLSDHGDHAVEADGQEEEMDAAEHEEHH